MAEGPKVFISYSHDSPRAQAVGIRNSVQGFATTVLMQYLINGILTLDQDLTQFVESSIKDANRVLVVCTDSYVRKANAGEEGVGYEPMIVTRKLVEDHGTNKFIPDNSPDRYGRRIKRQNFLKERVYIEFTDNNQFDEKLKELLHERLLVPSLQRSYVPHIESMRVKNYRALTGYRIKTTQTINCFFRSKR